MTKQNPLDVLSRGFFVIPSFRRTPEPTGLLWLASGPPPQENVIPQWIPAFAGKTMGPISSIWRRPEPRLPASVKLTYVGYCWIPAFAGKTGFHIVNLAKARIQIARISQTCLCRILLDSSLRWKDRGSISSIWRRPESRLPESVKPAYVGHSWIPAFAGKTVWPMAGPPYGRSI